LSGIPFVFALAKTKYAILEEVPVLAREIVRTYAVLALIFSLLIGTFILAAPRRPDILDQFSIAKKGEASGELMRMFPFKDGISEEAKVRECAAACTGLCVAFNILKKHNMCKLLRSVDVVPEGDDVFGRR
jgi:hypothetical protein